MLRALDEMVIVGVPTSQPFHRRVMLDPAFRSGEYDIEYLQRAGDKLLARGVDEEELERIAIAAALAADGRRDAAIGGVGPASGSSESAWLLAARRAGLR
jgi:acetyl/propionyl-CoA carboxylase alpha subunit